MPTYAVNYFTENQWVVIIEADSYEDACVHWMDPAYHLFQPECISEDMMDTDVMIEEMDSADYC